TNQGVLGFEPPRWLIACFIVGVLAAGIITRGHTPDRRFAQILAAASVTFLAVCLILQTPLDRTVAFVIVPFLLVAAVVVERWLRRREVRRWRPLIAVVVLVPALVAATTKATGVVAALPSEDWRGAAAFIDKNLPAGMPVAVSRNPEYLAAYLTSTRKVTT